MEGNNSEVARLRRQIELEYQAMQAGLNGYAITARHNIIEHRYDAIGLHHERLIQILGEQKAAEVVIEVLETTEEIKTIVGKENV